MCVERKAIPDLRQSLASGRLFHQVGLSSAALLLVRIVQALGQRSTEISVNQQQPLVAVVLHAQHAENAAADDVATRRRQRR
jgi:ERCC4-type nuclease